VRRRAPVEIRSTAARTALIRFLEPPGPPKEAPKFLGVPRKIGAEEAAAFAEGGETLSPKEPLFPPQERQLIGEVEMCFGASAGRRGGALFPSRAALRCQAEQCGR